MQALTTFSKFSMAVLIAGCSFPAPSSLNWQDPGKREWSEIHVSYVLPAGDNAFRRRHWKATTSEDLDALQHEFQVLEKHSMSFDATHLLNRIDILYKSGGVATIHFFDVTTASISTATYSASLKLRPQFFETLCAMIKRSTGEKPVFFRSITGDHPPTIIDDAPAGSCPR